MAPQADPQSGKCSSVDHLSYTFFKNLTFTIKNGLVPHVLISTPVFIKNTFSFGAIWDLFLEEYIAFCDGFDIILKYEQKSDLLNKNKCDFS